MDIVFIPISSYGDIEYMESEVCRLLRCSRGKCAAMHTQAFLQLRLNLLCGKQNSGLGVKIYLPEGLVLQALDTGVQLSWMYAETH
jgi:hypothetical protein